MYVCVYEPIYVCMYVYIHTHTHTSRFTKDTVRSFLKINRVFFYKKII